MNKSFITNLLASICVAAGLIFDQPVVLSVGLFALSGAVTNLLAIHMLFEKVPFLYGSGVIALKFESFKVAIRNLILTEFSSVLTIPERRQRRGASAKVQFGSNTAGLTMWQFSLPGG